jgi:hypothetical protein
MPMSIDCGVSFDLGDQSYRAIEVVPKTKVPVISVQQCCVFISHS